MAQTTEQYGKLFQTANEEASERKIEAEVSEFANKCKGSEWYALYFMYREVNLLRIAVQELQ